MDPACQSMGPNREQASETAEELTLIIPVYREAEELPDILNRIHRAVSSAPVQTEVLFIDDGSPDASLEILLGYTQKNAYARVVGLKGNHGQHTAVFAGIELARGKKVATMEAHPEHEIEDLFELYAKMDEKTDLVGGVRAGRSLPWWRHIGSWLLNRILRTLGLSPFHDLGCQLVIWKKSVAHEAFYMAARLPWHEGLGHLLHALRGRHIKNHRVLCRYTSNRPSSYRAATLFKGAFFAIWTALRLRMGASADLSKDRDAPYELCFDSALTDTHRDTPADENPPTKAVL